jgi:ABC-type lipoprotein release transport system permease subunit
MQEVVSMRRAFDIVMRIVTSLVGLMMLVSGSVWMMQGLGVGPAVIMQGFMVNDLRWTLYGAIVAVIGIAQIVWSFMRAKV